MAENQRGSGKQKTLHIKQDKKTAASIHQKYVEDYAKLTPSEQKTKNRIPYFYAENDPNDLWYIDPKKAKGGGFTRLSTKLANNAKDRLNLKNKTPTLADAIEAAGDEEVGKNIFKAEKEAIAQKYKGRMDWHDVDHYNSAANPDAVHGSRNLFLQDAVENRSDQVRQVPEFKKKMLGITDRSNYFKLQGPWPSEIQRAHIRNGPNNEKEFAEYWYKKVKETVQNDNSKGLKINGKTNKGLKIGGGLVAAATLTPTVQAAEQARQEVIAGNYGAAAKTIGKDLAIQQTGGEVAARGLKLANKVVTSKLNPIVGKKIARTALKIVGKQVLKKGAALATGPAAPMLVAGMLVFDAYQAADALSGGALTQFFKTKQTGGRSGASMRINN